MRESGERFDFEFIQATNRFLNKEVKDVELDESVIVLERKEITVERSVAQPMTPDNGNKAPKRRKNRPDR